MQLREWLATIVIVAIVLIVLDGFRRKWRERNPVRIKLERSIPASEGNLEEELTRSELPSGGARTKPRITSHQPMSEDEFYGRHDDVDNDYDDFDEKVPVLMESVDIDPDDIRGQGSDEGLEDEEDEYEYEYEEGDYDSVNSEDDSETETYRDADPWEGDDFHDEDDADVDDDSNATEERIEPGFGDDDLDGEVAETGSTDSMRADPRDWNRDFQTELPLGDIRAADDDAEGQGESANDSVEEVIVINVMAKKGEYFIGKEMLPVLLKQGMQLGDMSIFHRHADASGKGPVIFSMANMVKPGTFDMSQMDEFTTPGVSFFMQLPCKRNNMQSFETMLSTVKALKDSLHGELKDENRSVLTGQTIEHCRQRIRDFELRKLSKK